jgi:ribosome-binding factor A
MNFKQFRELLESKQVGSLYHYTDIEGAKGILGHNTIYASEINDNPSVSTTRDKNFHKHDFKFPSKSGTKRMRAGVSTDISFELDGNKLSNNKKISPYSYSKRLKAIRGSENEEQVSGDIENAKTYIKKIRLHNKVDGETMKHLKSHNIPIEKHYD